MNLWKKFCKLDIIGKIYILILLFIIILAIITVIVRYTKKQNNTLETNQNNVEQQTVATTVEKHDLKNDSDLLTETSINTSVKEKEITNQYTESDDSTKKTIESQSTNSKKETTTQTNKKFSDNIESTTHTNQKVENNTQTESNSTKKDEIEQEIKLDFSKYDRYTPALNGGYTCFKKSDSEIAKLKGLIENSVKNFGYKNVNIIQNKNIAMSTSYFTANKTNVENKVYNSEDFTIYYYAEAEYTLSSKGVENLIQYRSYITVR